MAKRKAKIAIMHLDLGIGGAEQLVVNVAKLLKESSYEVTIFTTHHNTSHCFEETKPNGPLGADIRVHGDFLPRTILGRFTALCATIRMFYLVFVFLLFYSRYCYNFVFLDGISAPIPLLRFCGVKVLFYCHFPDLLLCTDRSGMLKWCYRQVMDVLEEFSTSCASLIVVNSRFTRDVFVDTFPRLAQRHLPQILYPVIKEDGEVIKTREEALRIVPFCRGYYYVFLSINRYERKKRIDFAIEALAALKQQIETISSNKQSKPAKKILLVIAGGYDERVPENIEVLRELQTQANKHNLLHACFHGSMHELGESFAQSLDIIFRTSISDQEKRALFRVSLGLLYTPDREHFGIAPLEAMSAYLPVIAVASGGPLETVKHDYSGFLCSPPQTGKQFAEWMAVLMKTYDPLALDKALLSNNDNWNEIVEEDEEEDDNDNEKEVKQVVMALQAAKHVRAKFSLCSMKRQLDDIVESMLLS